MGEIEKVMEKIILPETKFMVSVIKLLILFKHCTIGGEMTLVQSILEILIIPLFQAIGLIGAMKMVLLYLNLI